MNLQLGSGEGNSRFSTVRVAAEVDRMGLVFAVLETGKERGVEDRRSELTDASTNGIGEMAVHDRAGRNKPVRSGPLADLFV